MDVQPLPPGLCSKTTEEYDPDKTLTISESDCLEVEHLKQSVEDMEKQQTENVKKLTTITYVTNNFKVNVRFNVVSLTVNLRIATAASTTPTEATTPTKSNNKLQLR